ncbi:PREDICTED: signal-regulatory protein beta-1 isoform 3-like, partial [Mesitornis unicolor]|uniref:signal-regulatory protein beta-1 isoform 3-like n=1 Tax=Mesitornis unicolor TaxID=54374 RepID=UPI000529598B
GPPGPVKWLKGWGDGNQTVYADVGSYPRVERTASGSETDYSIRIGDFQPEDAGTYYCVKFRRSVSSYEEVFLRGGGTEVSLHETSLVPGMVAAAVVLCFLLLVLFAALRVYRRKRRAETWSQHPDGPVTMGNSLSASLRCCAGTPGTPSNEVLDTETSRLPNQ